MATLLLLGRWLFLSSELPVGMTPISLWSFRGPTFSVERGLPWQISEGVGHGMPRPYDYNLETTATRSNKTRTERPPRTTGQGASLGPAKMRRRAPELPRSAKEAENLVDCAVNAASRFSRFLRCESLFRLTGRGRVGKLGLTKKCSCTRGCSVKPEHMARAFLFSGAVAPPTCRGGLEQHLAGRESRQLRTRFFVR